MHTAESHPYAFVTLWSRYAQTLIVAIYLNPFAADYAVISGNNRKNPGSSISASKLHIYRRGTLRCHDLMEWHPQRSLIWSLAVILTPYHSLCLAFQRIAGETERQFIFA